MIPDNRLVPSNKTLASMGRRFYLDSPIVTDRATIGGAEAHHLQHVMRAAIGDEIVLFDGSGREFVGRVDRIGRSQVELVITSTMQVDRELPRSLIVGVALPKGDRQRWLIEKLVELGASQVVPLRSEHSVVHPEPRSLEKLRRFVLEASKQCGRNRLMEVAPLTRLEEFLASAPNHAVRWFADPAGHRSGVEGGSAAGPRATYVAVGPEGGFSQAERSYATSAKWRLVSLGPRILRIETACLALATVVSLDLRYGVVGD